MSELTIAQSSKYRGNDYWDWSVWIEGTPTALGAIKHVIWLLHPTFPNPTVVRTDPKTKFRLDTAGWGTFEVIAELSPKRGKPYKLRCSLQFEEGREPAKPRARREKTSPSIMLSYAAADALRAGEVRELLKAEGVRVVEAADLPSGQPSSVKDAITRSNGMIALSNPNRPSVWVDREVAYAEKIARPVLTIDTSSRPDQVPALLTKIMSFTKKL